MTITQDILIEAVLQNLRRLAAGQTVAAHDAERVTTWINPVYEDISNRDIYAVGDEEDIEAAAFPHLVDLVSVRCAPVFGRDTIRGEKLSVVQRTAEDALRVVGRDRPISNKLTTENFGRGGRTWFNGTSGQ